MEFKRIISPIVLIGLFAAFGFICLMVTVTKSKNARWIARKMKIGAAIITLTGITTGCPPSIITCYVMPAPNQFEFDNMDQQTGDITAEFPNDTILSGTVYECNIQHFNFEIRNNDSTIVQQGEIVATDGAFDSTTEQFKLHLDSKLDTGMYLLNINEAADDSLLYDEYPIRQVYLKINRDDLSSKN